jgi:hypothetical protein
LVTLEKETEPSGCQLILSTRLLTLPSLESTETGPKMSRKSTGTEPPLVDQASNGPPPTPKHKMSFSVSKDHPKDISCMMAANLDTEWNHFISESLTQRDRKSETATLTPIDCGPNRHSPGSQLKTSQRVITRSRPLITQNQKKVETCLSPSSPSEHLPNFDFESLSKC